MSKKITSQQREESYRRQRSYWWCRVRITIYITMAILQLFLIVYDNLSGVPTVGYKGLLWQLILRSTPAMFFVYPVLIIVVTVKMNRITTYEDRHRRRNFEIEERKWRKNAAKLGLFLIAVLAIAAFIGGGMGVFNYVKDLISEPKTEKMILNEVLYKHYEFSSKQRYSWLFPKTGGGEFTLFFTSYKEKDEWGFKKYYHFHVSQSEVDGVDQMVHGVLVGDKAFSADQFIHETDAKGLRGRGFREGLINGGKPVHYLVTYYPHTQTIISTKLIKH